MNIHLQKVKTYLSESCSSHQSYLLEHFREFLSPLCSYQEIINPQILLIELVNQKYIVLTQELVNYTTICFQNRSSQKYQLMLYQLNSEMKKAFKERNFFKAMLYKVQYFLIASRKLPKFVSELKQLLSEFCTFTVIIHSDTLIEELIKINFIKFIDGRIFISDSKNDDFRFVEKKRSRDQIEESYLKRSKLF
eukprot:gene4466-7847_t